MPAAFNFVDRLTAESSAGARMLVTDVGQLNDEHLPSSKRKQVGIDAAPFDLGEEIKGAGSTAPGLPLVMG